ncbi:MAG: Crp/Fnr family transcriptional regulator [Nitrosomonas sp.]|uniref:Crp/Fnr family transcriptional regulator n=1 Tax=Nitrosomonas sp. TaxID=42353 RepID=UPI0027166DC0|nr:Crp/Fnr family transcriptional regulator [Nitrosomonas sp.]MDO8893794.1 Crp/Fnr family transcriptional regulator [Nitrosomonas sp.]MDO9469533.1 Crp/Fnr family transcriptional regulator [Nitrosomonas sp.]
MTLTERSAKPESMDAFFERGFEQLKQDYPSIQEINAASKNFLYRQGDHCTYVFWIKSGIVKLSHLTTQGTEITIALLRKGDVIGHLQGDSVHQEMEETAQALGEVSYCRLAYSDFKAMLSNHAELAWHVFEETYARKQKIERKLRTILTQPVEMRLAATLLELAEMFGIRCTHGYALEIHLTQQDVADLIGASRPVVSTILNDFRNRGMLDYTRDQICINGAVFSDFCHTK